MQTGYIHSIETFGTRDGPGIRFVVFMQGCPMRCLYCHNPDTWKLKEGKEARVEELITKLKRNKPYIIKSNGGLTISGGEPTMQFEFTLELLKMAKEEGFHTAVDTCGYIAKDKFREMIPYIDLVLLDIKQIDDLKHQELTGVSNNKTLEIVSLLEEEEQDYWIRYVLVPGYTDKREDLKKLADFLSTKKHMVKFELLPYHNLGAHKWQELDLEYQLEEVLPPEEEKIKEIIDFFKEYNINIE
ncbi:pyruvate formate-lyase-activating protein [Natronospora cellulosivora (SeqCode)]